jgi:hypothetical protein
VSLPRSSRYTRAETPSEVLRHVTGTSPGKARRISDWISPGSMSNVRTPLVLVALRVPQLGN